MPIFSEAYESWMAGNAALSDDVFRVMINLTLLLMAEEASN